MNEMELQVQFELLQRKLAPLWREIGRPHPAGEPSEAENTVVVVPSLTLDDVKLDIYAQQAYEERMLFMLFLLRQPNVRLVYITSLPVQQEIIEYYLHILPSVTINNARKRLRLLSPQDATSKPLTRKLLERPWLLEEIKAAIPNLELAHLAPFLTTDLERELAVRLGIPMYAADPRYFAFGTKSGCRRVFAEEGVAHPLGVENLHSEEDLVQAILGMRRLKNSLRQRPDLSKLIVKHNEGVSGYGNAQLDLDGLPAPGDPGERQALIDRLQTMQIEMHGMGYQGYLDLLAKQGGIVEEFISGDEFASPSVQLRTTPLGELEILSTHDQMLGGPSGQIYLGAKFPAHPDYAPLIAGEAEKVGLRFAREGIIGRFALDFLVTRSKGGAWRPYAIEVNLRKGGTTHPYLTLQYLTGGTYNAERGEYRTARGQAKAYVATDNLKSPAYRAFTPERLMDLVSQTRLHFDHTSQTGIVMHMLSGVASDGRLGLTAIGDEMEGAERLYGRMEEVMGKG